MNILILEPFFGGSHKSWIEGLQKHSNHEIDLLCLPDKQWKWRMHGGAISLAEEFSKSKFNPDLIIASDMLDLTSFQSLTRSQTAQTPMAMYFHENQLSYPRSAKDSDSAEGRDFHYGFINIISALSSNAILFNSDYHRENFLSESKLFLEKFKDFNSDGVTEELIKKSSILPVGLELEKHETNKANETPIVLWNHRWEYDKNPELFFETLFLLDEKNIDFELVVLGENFQSSPEIFKLAKERLAKRILHWGYAPSRKDYIHWLSRADILPVTSIQEFFGISVCEAIFCGCRPLLPHRLSYPELIPTDFHETVLYYSDLEFVEKLESALLERDTPKWVDELSESIERFSWENLIQSYDTRFVQIIHQNPKTD